MAFSDKLKGGVIALNTDRDFTLTLNGTDLTGASVVVYFKKKLTDPDSLALKKGSASPLSGITITSNTGTQIVAKLSLNPADFTGSPLSISTTRAQTKIFYAIHLKDSAGEIINITGANQDTFFTVNLTAIGGPI